MEEKWVERKGKEGGGRGKRKGGKREEKSNEGRDWKKCKVRKVERGEEKDREEKMW